MSQTFTQPNALATVLYGSSTIGIMAVGVSLLMIGGEFDLSTGVAVISSALTASMFSWYFTTNVWVGVALALVVSLGIGFINGWILIKTKLPSFIVTLATFLMLTGLNLGLTRLIGGGVSSPSISTMDGFESARAVFASSVNIGGVEVKITVFIWIALVAVASWVLMRTRVGNWIFAVGGDANAARAVGVPVKGPRSACSWRWVSAAGSWACTTSSPSMPCSPVKAWATSSSTSSPRLSAAAS